MDRKPSLLQRLPLDIGLSVVALLGFDDLRSAARSCQTLRASVQDRVLAVVVRSLRLWWPTDVERLLILMEGCGLGITGTAAARVLMELGVEGAETVYHSCLWERCTFLLPNDKLARVCMSPPHQSTIVLTTTQHFERFVQESDYWRGRMEQENPSWYALETTIHRPTWFAIDNSWRLAKPALHTHGYRSRRQHTFEGEKCPRTLEVETMTAWGSAALDTLLRTSEAPFGAFITCNRLGLLLTDAQTDPLTGRETGGGMVLQEGPKTSVVYLQFTTYRHLLRRS